MYRRGMFRCLELLKGSPGTDRNYLKEWLLGERLLSIRRLPGCRCSYMWSWPFGPDSD
jgi:hypothetical protein